MKYPTYIFKASALAVLAIGGVLASSGGALASPRDAVFEAKVLADKASTLRAAVRTYSASRLADQVACDLEAAVAELCQQLTCPHEIQALQCAMRDTAVQAQTAAAVIQRLCSLNQNPIIADELNCVFRQLARTQAAVDQVILAQAAVPRIQQGAYRAPGSFGGVSSPFGQVAPQPSWVTQGRIGPQFPQTPQASHSSRFAPAAVRPAPRLQPALPPVAIPRTDMYRGRPPLPGFGQGPRPPQRGEFGRALLSLMLSEMAR